MFHAHELAVAAGAHSVASSLASSGAHMEAASRYADTALRLARGLESRAHRDPRGIYRRRIVLLLGRSASLSARAARVVVRLARHAHSNSLAPDDGSVFANKMRELGDVAPKLTRLAREISANVHENLALKAKAAAVLEETARRA